MTVSPMATVQLPQPVQATVARLLAGRRSRRKDRRRQGDGGGGGPGGKRAPASCPFADCVARTSIAAYQRLRFAGAPPATPPPTVLAAILVRRRESSGAGTAPPLARLPFC